MKSKILKQKDERRSERIADALFDTKSADILKTEGRGFLETEGVEKTYEISQNQIKKEVDINTQRKMFSLTLDQFGPYKVRFDRPGRHLLLSGEKGHIAMVRLQEFFQVDGRSETKSCVRVPCRGAHLRHLLPA